MADDVVAARAPAPVHLDELRRRAKALARAPQLEHAARLMPAVIFSLADENYAIDARIVLQVHVLRDLTPLAGARAPLFGITHWRGTVLTILDLRERLGVRSRGVTDLSRVIVVNGRRQPFGILVDAARDFVQIDASMVRPLPADETGAETLIRGITDDAVLVLDTDAVLGAGRSAVTADNATVRGG